MLLEAERALVVRYARRLRPDGLVVGTAGNLSVRAGELVVITPSGLDYDELSAADVAVVAADGSREEGGAPSTELPTHLAAYRATGATAVVHTHSPYATAVACVEDELPPVHYLIAELGGPVPVVEYATPGTDELASAVAHALAGRPAALLRSHGAFVTGPSIERAYDRALTLEWLAALYLRARLLGRPHLLPEEELARLERTLRSYRAAACAHPSLKGFGPPAD